MFEESWWIEGRVCYTRFIGVSNMEEILAIDARLVALLDNTEKPIHFVIDVRDLTQVPTLDQGLKLHHLRHAKAGWVM